MKTSVIYIWMIAFFLCSSCESEDENIFTTVTLQAQMPDNTNIVRMEVDKTLTGTYFRNMNTRQNFDIPLFSNGIARIIVPKGLYLIAFDATVIYANGETHTVRYTESNSPANAVRLLEDAETLVLNLTLLN